MSVPPKHPAQRRRRAKPVGGDWVFLNETYSGPIPPLPKSIEWSDDTRRWWEAVWRTPMATQWVAGDEGALSLLALIRQRFLEGDTRLAREVRLASSDFGLTPKGRQLRRWVITEKDAERAGFVGDEVADLRKQRAKRVSE